MKFNPVLFVLALLAVLFTSPVFAHRDTPPPATVAPVGGQSDHKSLCEKLHCKTLGVLGLIGVGIHYAPKGTNDVAEDREQIKVIIKPMGSQ